MSRMVSAIGVFFALSIMAISATVNARYGMSLAREGFDQWVMVAVALFVDGGKALSWIFFAGAVGRREWLAAAAAGLIFVGCMVYAVSGSLGYVAMNRAQSTASVASGADSARALDEELSRKREELKAFGLVEPAAVIAKAIEAKKVDRIYTATRQCTDATATSSRSFCASLALLEGQKSKAEAKAALETELTALQARRDALGGVAVVEKGDFQGALLAQLTKLNVSDVQLSLALLFVIVVESGACFFLWLALNHGDRARAVAVALPVQAPPAPAVAPAPVAPQPLPSPSRPVVVASAPERKALPDRQVVVKPKGDLAGFVEKCIDPMPGGCEAVADVAARYKEWCAEIGAEPMDDTTFGEALAEFCERVEIPAIEVKGRICLDGLVLVREKRRRARGAR